MLSDKVKGKLLKTVGWTAIGVGAYLVYKGSELDVVIRDGVIDAVFEVIEED